MSLFGKPGGYRSRPMRRPAPARARPLLGPDFPGGRFPIGSPVSFEHRGAKYGGEVIRLRPDSASVGVDENTEWTVPYELLRLREGAPEPHCSLVEADRLGRELIRHHTGTGELKGDWKFGFNLDAARAGVCRYGERRIEVSVSYCHRALPRQVERTILHEIAHAIVGYDEKHRRVFKEVCLRIGGDPRSCHEVEHTPPRWMGLCGCGNRFPRHRLSRRARTGVCPKCRARIRWQRHVGGFVGNGADGPADDTEPTESRC